MKIRGCAKGRGGAEGWGAVQRRGARGSAAPGGRQVAAAPPQLGRPPTSPGCRPARVLCGTSPAGSSLRRQRRLWGGWGRRAQCGWAARYPPWTGVPAGLLLVARLHLQPPLHRFWWRPAHGARSSLGHCSIGVGRSLPLATSSCMQQQTQQAGSPPRWQACVQLPGYRVFNSDGRSLGGAAATKNRGRASGQHWKQRAAGDRAPATQYSDRKQNSLRGCRRGTGLGQGTGPRSGGDAGGPPPLSAGAARAGDRSSRCCSPT